MRCVPSRHTRPRHTPAVRKGGVAVPLWSPRGTAFWCGPLPTACPGGMMFDHCTTAAANSSMAGHASDFTRRDRCSGTQ